MRLKNIIILIFTFISIPNQAFVCKYMGTGERTTLFFNELDETVRITFTDSFGNEPVNLSTVPDPYEIDSDGLYLFETFNDNQYKLDYSQQTLLAFGATERLNCYTDDEWNNSFGN